MIWGTYQISSDVKVGDYLVSHFTSGRERKILKARKKRGGKPLSTQSNGSLGGINQSRSPAEETRQLHTVEHRSVKGKISVQNVTRKFGGKAKGVRG